MLTTDKYNITRHIYIHYIYKTGLREADRQTETETDRDRQTDRQTETGRQKQRQQDKQIEKKANRFVR